MGDGAQAAEVLLKHFGLRVRPEMGQFVLRRLNQSADAMIPVMGGDARTGVAVRQLLAAERLRAAFESNRGA